MRAGRHRGLRRPRLVHGTCHRPVAKAVQRRTLRGCHRNWPERRYGLCRPIPRSRHEETDRQASRRSARGRRTDDRRPRASEEPGGRPDLGRRHQSPQARSRRSTSCSPSSRTPRAIRSRSSNRRLSRPCKSAIAKSSSGRKNDSSGSSTILRGGAAHGALALGRCGTVHDAMLIVKSLDDPDINVVVEANNALCWLSRRPNGFGRPVDPLASLPENANEQQRRDTMQVWCCAGPQGLARMVQPGGSLRRTRTAARPARNELPVIRPPYAARL